MLPRARRMLQLLWVFGLLLVALAIPRGARAAQPPPEPSPRDIGSVTSTSPFELGAPPADFQRIDQGGIALEFPASVRSRIEPLVDEVDSMRGRLTKDLGQSVLS